MSVWITRLADLSKDWNYLIKQQGLGVTLPQVGQEIISLPYRQLKFYAVARSLLDPLPDLKAKIDLEIRDFEKGDLEFVGQIYRPSEARLFAQRLDRGHQGLMALHQGQPAGFAWGCGEIDPELDRVELKLEPGDMLCVDVYTNPVFRGQGVHTALTIARFKYFRDLGYRRAIAYIETRNGPSLAVWRKFGSEIIGEVDFKRLGPWRWGAYRPVTAASPNS